MLFGCLCVACLLFLVGLLSCLWFDLVSWGQVCLLTVTTDSALFAFVVFVFTLLALVVFYFFVFGP